MDRRTAVKAVASVATTFGVTSIAADAASAREPGHGQAIPAPAFVGLPDGTQLALRSWGRGRPVVFVHAWGLTSDSWQYQMLPLSEQGVRCIAYDRRGHGRSSDPGTGYDFTTLADDLAAVLTRLDLRDVTLVGHSIAAGELVRYLVRHGDSRIARMILVAPACTPFLMWTPDNPTGTRAEVTERARQESILHDLPSALEGGLPGFLLPESPRPMLDWFIRMMQGNSFKAMIDTHRAMTATDFRRELPTIKVPTLIIHGDKDMSAPIDRTGRPTAAMIPGARLVVYEGAPHGLIVTHMQRLTDDIKRFVEV